MARKLVAKTGVGEIFSADDFFIDLAGRCTNIFFVHVVGQMFEFLGILSL